MTSSACLVNVKEAPPLASVIAQEVGPETDSSKRGSLEKKSPSMTWAASKILGKSMQASEIVSSEANTRQHPRLVSVCPCWSGPTARAGAQTTLRTSVLQRIDDHMAHVKSHTIERRPTRASSVV